MCFISLSDAESVVAKIRWEWLSKQAPGLGPEKPPTGSSQNLSAFSSILVDQSLSYVMSSLKDSNISKMGYLQTTLHKFESLI